MSALTHNPHPNSHPLSELAESLAHQVGQNPDLLGVRVDDETGFSHTTVGGEIPKLSVDEGQACLLEGLRRSASEDEKCRQEGACLIALGAEADVPGALWVVWLLSEGDYPYLKADYNTIEGFRARAESLEDLPELDNDIRRSAENLHDIWLGNPYSWRAQYNDDSGCAFAEIEATERSQEVLKVAFAHGLKGYVFGCLQTMFYQDGIILQCAESNYLPAQLLLAVWSRIGFGGFQESSLLTNGWLGRASLPNSHGQQIKPGGYGYELYTPTQSPIQLDNGPGQAQADPGSTGGPEAEPANDREPTVNQSGDDKEQIEQIDGVPLEPIYNLVWEDGTCYWLYHLKPRISINCSNNELSFDTSSRSIGLPPDSPTFQKIAAHCFYDGLGYMKSRDYMTHTQGVSLVLMAADGNNPEALLKVAQWALTGAHHLPQSDEIASILFDRLEKVLNTRPHNVLELDRTLPGDWLEKEGEGIGPYRISRENWSESSAH